MKKKMNVVLIYCLCFSLTIGYGCSKVEDTIKPANTNPKVVNSLSGSSAFYIDAIRGNDITGNGRQAKPFKSFNRAMDSLKSGDVLFVNNGNYGDIVVGRTPGNNWGSTPSEITVPFSKFTNWVTVKAAPGQTPHINTLSIGTLNIPNSGSPSKRIDFIQKGNSNLYMSFDGITIDDGVTISGSRYINITNCTINRIGALNGSVSNIDNKVGILIQNGRYITIANNEITHVSIGIEAGSYDLVIKNNNIHNNSHDGIRAIGGDSWLIEGNKIHDLDDGVDDNSGYNWNRHSDGIQVFTIYDVTNNLTIRGNLFYHLEAMGIMINASTVSTTYYQKWIIENNIFGPVGGTTVHFGADIRNGLVFRHNTIVYAPKDVWQSIYRPMNGKIYHLAMWSADYTNNGSRFYNNILTTDSKVPDDYDFHDGNIYYDPSGSKACPYEPIPGNIANYIASGKTPGTLISNSAAIDAGSTKYASELKIDFLGNSRDSKPDVGAFEKQK